MMRFDLYMHLIGCDRKVMEDVGEEQIRNAITLLFDHKKGTLSLESSEPPEIGIQRCEIHLDEGRYIISALVLTDNDAENISYSNSRSNGGSTEILGNLWSNAMICDDVSVAEEAFLQYYRAGKISEDLLN